MKEQFLHNYYIKHRQQQIIRAAENHRHHRAAQVYRPGLAAHILGSVGGWMVAQGTRLQSRYQAASAVSIKRQTGHKTEILFG